MAREAHAENRTIETSAVAARGGEQAETPTFEKELLSVLPRLRAIAVMLTRDRVAADDLLQDSIVLALSAKHSYTLGTNLAAWMYRLMRNRLISLARRRRPSTVPLEDPIANSVSTAPEQDGRMMRLLLERELAHLPIGQREALILVGAAGQSYAEAAVALGCTVGTVKSRVSRARETLRQRLEGDEVTAPPQDNEAHERPTRRFSIEQALAQLA
jgi:RNA polymerase sigma-70 factor, ECF subfamily